MYQIFYRWRLNGIWERLHDAMRDRARKQMGRNRLPTAGIIESKSVKTTEAGGIKGFDAGKKVNGRKRHLIVVTQGFLLAVVVHSTDQQDQDGACLVLSALWEKLKRVRVIFADSAYARRGLPAFVQST